MLDQDSSFSMISLNILIICLLNNVWILLGEVSCQSLLGVKGLSRILDMNHRRPQGGGTKERKDTS